MPENAPTTHRLDGQNHTVIASSPYMPDEDRLGKCQPMINILRNDETGRLRLQISDLDPTNFEAVVGAKSARRYRAFVRARRSQGYSSEDRLVEQDKRAEDRAKRITSLGIFGKLFISK